MKKIGRPQKLYEFMGEYKTVRSWAEDVGLSYPAVYNRLKSGMSLGEALTKPKSKRVISFERPRLSEGFSWIGKYDVLCPDGNVLSGVSKRKNHYPKPMSSQCIECGSVFYWDLVRRGKNNPKQFCNKSCSCIHRNKKMAGVSRERLYDDIEAKCMGCGIEFIANWTGSGGYRKYCNAECFHKHGRKGAVRLGDRPLSEFGMYVGAERTGWSRLIQVDCFKCGTLTTKHRYSRGGSRYCSDDCWQYAKKQQMRESKRASNSYSHVKRAKLAGSDWEYGVTLKALAKRDNMECQICGCKVHRHKGPRHGWQPRAWSIDHIVAINGPCRGSHTWDNVQLACIECNTMKGTKDMDEVAA